MSTLNANIVKTTTIEHTNATDALLIDTLGRVTSPNNPSFEAVRNAGTVGVQYTANQEVVFDVTNSNIGNNYNTSTGRFTAPVSGTYYFQFFGMTQATSWYNIRRNGLLLPNPTNAYSTSVSSIWVQSVVMSVMYLNIGDYASVFIGTSGSGLYAGGNNHNCFTGFLIG